MDDLISRQAAIDHWRLIIDATNTDSRYNMGFVDGLEFCISHLSTMPSAQPEISCSEIPNNSDAISRQAAIDALDEIEAEVADGYGYQYAKWREYFAEMPSAQQEIVRCKDCDWWTKQEDSLQGRCALLQMYPTGGWFCGNARRREVTK